MYIICNICRRRHTHHITLPCFLSRSNGILNIITPTDSAWIQELIMWGASKIHKSCSPCKWNTAHMVYNHVLWLLCNVTMLDTYFNKWRTTLQQVPGNTGLTLNKNYFTNKSKYIIPRIKRCLLVHHRLGRCTSALNLVTLFANAWDLECKS